MSAVVFCSNHRALQKKKAIFLIAADCSCRLLLGELRQLTMMRDRRKELIRQWLKEPIGSEDEKFTEKDSVVSQHHHHHAKPEYTFTCHRQAKREENCVERTGLAKAAHEVESLQNGRRWCDRIRINNNSIHDHDNERSKYRKMLVQFLESQNRVFCFPPHLNSFQRMLVHVEAGKLGLEHRSCGQGWERFVVVTKPGTPKEAGKSENAESGGNEEVIMSEEKSIISRNLPSLASKLAQVIGRSPSTGQIDTPEGNVKLKEGNGIKKGDECEDNSRKDHNHVLEKPEAKPEERVAATVPSAALPDDPHEIQRLRAEFEKRALIFPEEDEFVSTSSTDSSPSQSTLYDANAADKKPDSVEPTHSLTSVQCTLTLSLPGGAVVDELKLQKITDDLAWFENLVSIKAVGKVVKIPEGLVSLASTKFVVNSNC